MVTVSFQLVKHGEPNIYLKFLGRIHVMSVEEVQELADAIAAAIAEIRISIDAPDAASHYDELPGYSYWDDPTPGED